MASLPGENEVGYFNKGGKAEGEVKAPNTRPQWVKVWEKKLEKYKGRENQLMMLAGSYNTAGLYKNWKISRNLEQGKVKRKSRKSHRRLRKTRKLE
jgi:hypothetical protein